MRTQNYYNTIIWLYSYILEDHGTHVSAGVKCRQSHCYSLVYLIPLLMRSTFLTRREGRLLFVEIPLTTSANSVSSTSEGSAAGGRAGETVVLRRRRKSED